MAHKQTVQLIVSKYCCSSRATNVFSGFKSLQIDRSLGLFVPKHGKNSKHRKL